MRIEAQRRMLLRRLQSAKLPPAPSSGSLAVAASRDFEAAIDDARTLAGDVTNLAEQQVQVATASSRAIAEFDAARRFALEPAPEPSDAGECLAGEVLRGVKRPNQCPVLHH